MKTSRRPHASREEAAELDTPTPHRLPTPTGRWPYLFHQVSQAGEYGHQLVALGLETLPSPRGVECSCWQGRPGARCRRGAARFPRSVRSSSSRHRPRARRPSSSHRAAFPCSPLMRLDHLASPSTGTNVTRPSARGTGMSGPPQPGEDAWPEADRRYLRVRHTRDEIAASAIKTSTASATRQAF